MDDAVDQARTFKAGRPRVGPYICGGRRMVAVNTLPGLCLAFSFMNYNLKGKGDGVQFDGMERFGCFIPANWMFLISNANQPKSDGFP